MNPRTPRFVQDQPAQQFAVKPISRTTLTTTVQTLVEATDFFLIQRLYIANTSASARNWTLYMVNGGEVADSTTSIASDVARDGNTAPLVALENVLLEPGAQLRGESSNDVGLKVWGWGIDYAGGPLTW